MSDIFDFGFTAVNEQELEAVQVTSTEKVQLSKDLDECQERLNKMRGSIQILLDNLMVNPEKDYIYWPDRQAKVHEFERHLDNIWSGTR